MQQPRPITKVSPQIDGVVVDVVVVEVDVVCGVVVEVCLFTMHHCKGELQL